MTPQPPISQRLFRGDLSSVFFISLLKLALHMAVNASGGYGLFRDELYYIACSKELDLGYVDHPPLSVFLLRIITDLFGDSLFVVRLTPAMVSALSTFMIGLLTLRLGGGRLATILACTFSFSPIFLAMGGFYSMNAIDILIWIVAAYLIVGIVNEGSRKWWILLGVTLGLGLLNKIGVLFLGAGIFAGLLFTPQRRWLFTPWPYVAGAIAFVLFLPYVFWNIQHSFAHLEFIRNASEQKYSSQSALGFLAGQVLINNPVALLLWLPGLAALFFNESLKQYRIVAWMYVAPLIIFLVNGTSKSEYLAPAYGSLFAAGAVFWEQRTRVASKWKFALGAVFAGYLAFALILAPMVLPVLPVEKYISYSEAIGFKPSSPEGKEQSELPQFYADMFGWKEKAEGVAKVYHSLSEADQARCWIFASNYGRCGAIDYYGRDFGLPRAIGTHNNYWIWGPRGYNGEVLIILGGSLEDHRGEFEDVILAETVDCQYCMPYEDNLKVFVCRGLKANVASAWREEKHFE